MPTSPPAKPCKDIESIENKTRGDVMRVPLVTDYRRSTIVWVSVKRNKQQYL